MILPLGDYCANAPLAAEQDYLLAIREWEETLSRVNRLDPHSVERLEAARERRWQAWQRKVRRG